MSPTRRYILLAAVLLSGAVPLRAAGPALTPAGRATLTLDTPRLEGDMNAQTFQAEGPTTIRAQVAGQPQEQVLINAAAASANLATQHVQAGPNVRFVMPNAYLSGSELSLHLDPPRLFLMTQAQAVFNLNLGRPGQPPVLGQVRGENIGGNDQLFYVDHGMIAPSTDPKPDVYLAARRLEFRPATGRLTASYGVLHFYGLPIPLWPRMRKRIIRRPDAPPSLEERILPALRYGSRDGFNIPYFWDFSGDRPSSVTDALGITVTQKRGITFLGESQLQTPGETLGFYASRMEDVRDKLRGHLVYDRLPELFAEKFQHSRTQHDGWRLAMSLGNFNERDSDKGGPPEVQRQRGLLGAGYEMGTDQHLAKLGSWEQLWGTQAFYSGGYHYTDVALTLGAGQQLNPRLHAALSLIHHFTTGHTPFQFDAADIPSEVHPFVDWQATRDWRVVGEGRFDAMEGKLRDYQFAFSKRMHLLTWTFYYHFVGAVTGVRFDVNGLTGGTAPPPMTSDLAKAYFQSQQDLFNPPVAPGATPPGLGRPGPR